MIRQLQPWQWRSLPLENRSGSDVFDLLFRRQCAIATLLESPTPSNVSPSLAAQSFAPNTRYSICAGSPRIIAGEAQLWTPPVGEILSFLRHLSHSNTGYSLPSTLPPSIPFTGGWLGWLGYDLAWEIEQLPHLNLDPLPFPVAYWYEPECFAVLDHWQQTLWLAATNPQQLDLLQSQLESAKPEQHSPNFEAGSEGSPTPGPTFQLSQADYEQIVGQAKKYIQAGDIFQANLSLRFQAETRAQSWHIYQALQHINPSPFASYWQTPWGDVISCSPERLVERQRLENGKFQVSTRPIAGTRSRGLTPELDVQLAQELLAHEKEIAEHIMLVDLERNDLGRICEWGSVVVDELLTIERYSHVMHLVSNITGAMRPDCDAIDLIQALFPGGTITGCPKVRCMEIIEELEPVRRNLFYGSCGYLDWRGQLDLNILIRTLLYTPMESGRTLTNSLAGSSQGIVFGQVGAGIVADSDPEKEWYESLHKAQAQLTALQFAGMDA